MVSLNCEVWSKWFVMKSFANKLPNNINEGGVVVRSQQETEGTFKVGSRGELTGPITCRWGGQGLGDQGLGSPGAAAWSP